MTERAESCGACRWWGGAAPGIGRCHRRAPFPGRDLHVMGDKRELGDYMTKHADWPHVTEWGWCGEFEAIESESEEQRPMVPSKPIKIAIDILDETKPWDDRRIPDALMMLRGAITLERPATPDLAYEDAIRVAIGHLVDVGGVGREEGIDRVNDALNALWKAIKPKTTQPES